MQLVSGFIEQEQEKEAGSNVDSAILLSDLLIKLKTENDLEKNKSESGSKLERKREVVDERWEKVEKPNKGENPRKSGGDPDYRDSASRLSDLLIKLHKDNAEKVERKTNKELKPSSTSSSMLAAILGLCKNYTSYYCQSQVSSLTIEKLQKAC